MIVDLLKAQDACPEAIAWARQFQALEELWRACPHAEWMIWFVEQLGYQDDAGLRLFAAACARRHWHLLTDSRSRRAVEVAEGFARRTMSTGELVRARAAALAAAEDATVQRSWTSASAAAAMAAYHATRTTGIAAAMAAAKYGLQAAAWDTGTYITADVEDVWQSDQLRRIIGPNLPQIIELTRRKMHSMKAASSGALPLTRG
jgi:hypothetical protein